jgi:hypothetical protein
VGKTVKLAGFYQTVIQAGVKTRLGWRGSVLQRPRAGRECRDEPDTFAGCPSPKPHPADKGLTFML